MTAQAGLTPQAGGNLATANYVGYRLAVGDQPLGQVLADPIAALDRPYPIRGLAADGEHVLIAGRVRGEPSLAENTLGVVKHLDCGGLAAVVAWEASHPATTARARFFERHRCPVAGRRP